jgi:PKD repeat protein
MLALMSINLNVALPTSVFKVLNLRQATILTALIVLSIVLVISFAPQRTRAADEAYVWIDPPMQTVSFGQVFNVSIQVDNIPSPGAAGFQVVVRWDPSVLTGLNLTDVLFHSVVPEEQWSNIWTIESNINNEFGYSYYAVTFQDFTLASSEGYGPVTGNHTLATITLKGASTGETAMELWKVTIGDPEANPLPWVGAEGTVTVGNPAPIIKITSPRNGTYYNSSSVNLAFNLSKPAAWIGYSLDDHPNITVTGNTEIQTIDGMHKLVVYANDTLGQMGNSTRVFFAVDTLPPNASFMYSPSPPEAELFHGNFRWPLTFNGSTSSDATSGIFSYYWDFGNGDNSSDAESSHIYLQPGTYIVKLTVTDFVGNSMTKTETITINPASKPLSIPYGLVFAIVVPAIWAPALLYYFNRTRKTRVAKKKA